MPSKKIKLKTHDRKTTVPREQVRESVKKAKMEPQTPEQESYTPQLIKAGDERVLINGRPLLRDARIVSETLYQKLLSHPPTTDAVKPVDEDIEKEAEDYANSIDRAGTSVWTGMRRGYKAAMKRYCHPSQVASVDAEKLAIEISEAVNVGASVSDVIQMIQDGTKQSPPPQVDNPAVNEAMKIASKNVKAPKAVREGKVSPQVDAGEFAEFKKWLKTYSNAESRRIIGSALVNFESSQQSKTKENEKT